MRMPSQKETLDSGNTQLTSLRNPYDYRTHKLLPSQFYINNKDSYRTDTPSFFATSRLRREPQGAGMLLLWASARLGVAFGDAALSHPWSCKWPLTHTSISSPNTLFLASCTLWGIITLVCRWFPVWDKKISVQVSPGKVTNTVSFGFHDFSVKKVSVAPRLREESSESEIPQRAQGWTNPISVSPNHDRACCLPSRVRSPSQSTGSP